MKNKKRGRRNSALWGAITFFISLAFLMQMTILLYDYVSEMTSDKIIIAMLILIAIIIASFICTLIDFLKRRITIDKPVDKILDATERIARGDFRTRIEIDHEYGRYNEFDLIMENINTMSLELSKSEILKTDFISNVSHELKTPLSVIQCYSTLLKDDDLSKEERDKYTSTIITATKRLSNLVTNILKLNKLENQKIIPEYTNFNLTESLSQSILAYESIIEQKGLTLNCELDDIRVYSDERMLEIVWNNLISNAVKFTEEGGFVSVCLSRSERNVIINVSDTGCGIPPSLGAKIFEKFYQGDTSHAKEGNGLGLSLVKKVIDLLGGEISVSSTVGKGSIFTITLKDVVIQDNVK